MFSCSLFTELTWLGKGLQRLFQIVFSAVLLVSLELFVSLQSCKALTCYFVCSHYIDWSSRLYTFWPICPQGDSSGVQAGLPTEFIIAAQTQRTSIASTTTVGLPQAHPYPLSYWVDTESHAILLIVILIFRVPNIRNYRNL